jgi:hypothetical protein
MPIVCQDIVNQVAAELGAEGNDYYLWTRDYMPAIKLAIKDMVKAIRDKLGSNSFTEQAAQELKQNIIYQTNAFSRFRITDDIFSLVAVIPEPTMSPSNPSITSGTTSQSFKRTDVAFLGSTHTATRQTDNEFYLGQGNPFQDGFALEPERNIRTYSYILYGDSTAGSYAAGGSEIGLSPAVNVGFVAISQLINPTEPVNITDSIQFPMNLKSIIVLFTKHHITFKPLDSSQINLTTMDEITQALKAFE